MLFETLVRFIQPLNARVESCGRHLLLPAQCLQGLFCIPHLTSDIDPVVLPLSLHLAGSLSVFQIFPKLFVSSILSVGFVFDFTGFCPLFFPAFHVLWVYFAHLLGGWGRVKSAAHKVMGLGDGLNNGGLRK